MKASLDSYLKTFSFVIILEKNKNKVWIPIHFDTKIKRSFFSFLNLITYYENSFHWTLSSLVLYLLFFSVNKQENKEVLLKNFEELQQLLEDPLN